MGRLSLTASTLVAVKAYPFFFLFLKALSLICILVDTLSMGILRAGGFRNAEAFLFLRLSSAGAFLVVSNAAEPRFTSALQLTLSLALLSHRAVHKLLINV